MPNAAKPSPEFKDLEDQIKAIRKDLTDLTSLLKDLTGTKAAEAGETIQNEASEFLRKTRHAAEGAAEKAQSAAGTIEKHIIEKPVQSALIALLIGIVIGSWGRR
ncbi:MAG: hypothetical protein KDK89_10615 [Alphaproteobacteria bacterium]|nr:hypothetical protein [Alphaproteobacteria bacterium]